MNNDEYENGLVAIPVDAELSPSLDQVGREGWKPWAVLGMDKEFIRIAVVRRKRAITLATEIPTNGLIKS